MGGHALLAYGFGPTLRPSPGRAAAGWTRPKPYVSLRPSGGRPAQPLGRLLERRADGGAVREALGEEQRRGRRHVRRRHARPVEAAVAELVVAADLHEVRVGHLLEHAVADARPRCRPGRSCRPAPRSRGPPRCSSRRPSPRARRGLPPPGRSARLAGNSTMPFPEFPAAATTTHAAGDRAVDRGLHRLAEALAAQAEVDDLDRVRPALRVLHGVVDALGHVEEGPLAVLVEHLDRHDGAAEGEPGHPGAVVRGLRDRGGHVRAVVLVVVRVGVAVHEVPARQERRVSPVGGLAERPAPCAGRCSPRRRRRCRARPPRPTSCPSGCPRCARRSPASKFHW